MPLIYESGYSKRPFYLFNSYLETLYPYFTTKVCQVAYTRERLELPDGDFVDLDWVQNEGDRLVIISHGFEGNSKDHFIEKVAASLARQGYSILVWHYRSCSGELNRLPRLYHHGDTGDLGTVINHAVSMNRFNAIHLAGFSMGGNLVINYLGSSFTKQVAAAVVFSTAMDLDKANDRLSSGFNRLIQKQFFKKFKQKVARKQRQFPDKIDRKVLEQTTNLVALFEEVVVPLHGFSSMTDYFTKWSSLQYLQSVQIPLLIVNAKNDPLLSPACYPYDQCEASTNVFLETPRYGGHVGFTWKDQDELWYVKRIAEFFSKRSLDQ